MIFHVPSYKLLKACIEDILSTIKPGEDDEKKRLCAIQELADSIYSVRALRGICYKNFQVLFVILLGGNFIDMISCKLIKFMILEK
jgi:hypothetical protein